MLSISHIADAQQIYISGGWRTIATAKMNQSAGTGDLIAALADNKIYILGCSFSLDTDGSTIKLSEDGGGDILDPMTFDKSKGMVIPLSGKVWLKTSTVNKKVTCTTTIGKATGTVRYAYAP